jgi:hypothetical protein
MRDLETIDSELRLVAAALRRAAQERDEPLPSTAPMDELLDERLAHLAAGPRDLSASYRGNSRKSQPSICGGLLAELSADKDTLRDPACVLCRHLAVVAGHQVAYLDRLNLPAMLSQQVTDVGALLVEP